MSVVGSSRMTSGVLDQHVGEAEPLAHAPGVGLDGAVAGLRQADPLQQLVDARLGLGVGDAVEPGRVAQVLAARHGPVEADVVGQVADVPLDLERVARRVEAEDLGRAAGRLGQAEQHQDGRRLARAVGTEEAEHLALADVQVERADGDLVVRALLR